LAAQTRETLHHGAWDSWLVRFEIHRLQCRRLREPELFLTQVANRAAPTASRRNFGKEKGAVMKFAAFSKSIVLALALLLASSAFAASKGNLQLTHPVTVSGTTLKPGDYTVQWDGTGADVQVSIMQGKKVLAKVPGKVVDLSAPAATNAAVTQSGSDGKSALSGVRFEGKKFALEFGGSGDGMQSGSSK
jgi:hypothetical protein